jgi:hypothetical protein
MEALHFISLQQMVTGVVITLSFTPLQLLETARFDCCFLLCQKSKFFSGVLSSFSEMIGNVCTIADLL